DLEDNGDDSVLDYNWWGDNTPSIMANGTPFTPDKYFVVGITNITAIGHHSTALFNYTFGLNDNSSANATLLPYFVTDVWTNITTTGSVEVFNLLSFNPTGLTHISNFDARENKIIAVTLNLTNTQEVEFTFVTDNEVSKIDLLVYNNSGENIIINGGNGTYHTNITINATLSNLTGPLSNKTINFYIDTDGDFNGTGTADLIFIGTGITDANGFTNITYLINYTGNYSIFAIAFEDDNTTILTFNTTNLSFYPQNATITAYNNTTTVGVYPTLIANVTGQLDGQLEGVTVNFIVNGNIVGTSITNSSGIAIFTYTGTDFASNFTYSIELDNGNYSALNSTAEVFINKANININITTPNANVGQIINITLNITNLANSSYPINGLFNVSVGGVNYTNVNFINGLANVSYPVTIPANNLNITVHTNDYYNTNITNITVNFTKANIGINAIAKGSVGQIVNITLNLTNLANSSYLVNGLFNVSVGGVNYTNVNFINGLANVSYQVTAIDNSLNISVSGNDYYNFNNTSVIVNFTKANIGIGTVVPNGSVGQIVNITLNLTNLANSSYPVNGLFNVSVGGVNYTNVNFIDGLANVSHQITSSGRSLNISVSGNDYYNFNNTSVVVNFTKAKLGINAVVPSGSVGQVVNVPLNLTNLANSSYPVNGLFNVSVGGVNYTNVNFTNGLANISYQITALGSSLNIGVSGNDYYNFNNTSVVVNFTKANIGINIIAKGSVGQIVNITLNLTNLPNSSYLVNGLFNISVDGVDYANVNFTNGLANISYQVTALGSSLNIGVSGNDYYNFNNTSVVVNFTKANIGIGAVVPSGSVGDVVNVTLNLTNLANFSYLVNGLFNVSVDGVNYTNVNFVNGLAKVPYNIKESISSLNITINTNQLYNSNSTALDVNFSKQNVFLNINVPNGSVDDVVNVTVDVLDKNGNPLINKTVEIIVNGKSLGKFISDSK
ncbi:beta strand repeat-containing protein, partial [Methanobrevibacter filiformis]|uniref:beta strand repeat-containing protein n=1 Tax=Methanobrevibacter filiformis TaxID=55758 RepID=UPI000A7E96B7